MDLERERSVEGRALAETEVLGENGEIDAKLKDNGNCDSEKVDGKLLDDIKATPIVKTVLSPGGSIPATKGRGLRKWRRIPRESGKDSSGSLDSNRKRSSIAVPVGMKPTSEGSSSSTNAVSTAHGKALDHVPLYSDSGHGPTFAARTDSENSEDRNSRSSTAASAPRVNYELPFVGLGLDANMMRTQILGDQQEKGRNLTKKARGAKLKKENSYSSMESDSRSSNFVFAQGANSVTSNGRQSGRSANYDEDFSDDAQNGDRHLNNEAQIAFSKNEVDSEYVSHEDLAAENSWGVKEEKVDDRVGSGSLDALIECIMPLHLAQEALEKEVQKLKDVGKEDTLSSDDLVQPSGSGFIDEDIQSSKGMHTKLDEVQVMLELKDAKLSELESTLNLRDLKNEHEELLLQRIAAELEYLVISKMVQNLKEDHTDRINLTTQKKNLAAPKDMQDEDVERKDAYKLQNMVSRYTYCFALQLVLLLVAVYLFVLRFWSPTIQVMPT